MMYPNEKRRAMVNAIEQLHKAGAMVLGCSYYPARPVIEIDMPPLWLAMKATEVRERRGYKSVTSHIVKFSGCVVRWEEKELEQVSELIQHIGDYSQESIAFWPKNF